MVSAWISPFIGALCSFVVFFIDGSITETADPTSGEAGVSDWSYETIQKAAYMCHAGAEFVYTADDAFNPSVDKDFPGMVFPQPGPGMFAAMMKTAMFPQQSAHVACCGKGGNVGRMYMMEHAIKMLELQGHSGDRDRIMMIGDRFDTDIKAGCSVGIKTCLVESGCHSVDMQHLFTADAVADCYAADVGGLVPTSTRVPKPTRVTSSPSAMPSVQEEAEAEQSTSPDCAGPAAPPLDCLNDSPSAVFLLSEPARSGQIEAKEMAAMQLAPSPGTSRGPPVLG